MAMAKTPKDFPSLYRTQPLIHGGRCAIFGEITINQIGSRVAWLKGCEDGPYELRAALNVVTSRESALDPSDHCRCGAKER